VDSFLGNVLVNVLNEQLHPEIVGTASANSSTITVPKGVSQLIESVSWYPVSWSLIVTKGNTEALRKACLQADVIIYDLVQEPEEAKALIQGIVMSLLPNNSYYRPFRTCFGRREVVHLYINFTYLG
jgi:hypothetical protein